MDYGDTIVLADVHFPAYALGQNVLRAEGIFATELLKAILLRIKQDTYVGVSVTIYEDAKKLYVIVQSGEIWKYYF